MEKPKFLLPFEKPLKELEDQLRSIKKLSQESQVDLSTEIKALEEKIITQRKEIYANLGAWERVQVARHPERPYSLDYINRIFEDFQELHGDRAYKDDQAIIGGTATFEGQPVMIIAQQKGRNTKENIRRNFGCPNPEGYRKALRLMRLANKFKLPIISLVDTSGAYPGVGSEERHVAEAIAVNIREMSNFRVPIIAIIIGEGGSGGALGVATADRVLIFENAYYSVISPEGCAAILWKDRAQAPKAAEALQLTASRLLELGVVDQVLPEPPGGAHMDHGQTAVTLQTALKIHLAELTSLTDQQLLAHRYQKYRTMGVFEESLHN